MRRVAALLGVLELARETTADALGELRRRLPELEREVDREDQRILAGEDIPAPALAHRRLLEALGDLEGHTAYLSVLDLQIEQIEGVRTVERATEALADLVEQADEIRETAPAKYREHLIEAEQALSAAMGCDDPSTALDLCDQALERVRVTLAQRRDLGICERPRTSEQIGLGLGL